MIEIDLKLFVNLAKYHPKGEDGAGTCEVAEGTEVGQLMAALGIPKDEVKLIFINGRKAPLSQVLNPGDRLGLFPPVGGG